MAPNQFRELEPGDLVYAYRHRGGRRDYGKAELAKVVRHRGINIIVEFADGHVAARGLVGINSRAVDADWEKARREAAEG